MRRGVWPAFVLLAWLLPALPARAATQPVAEWGRDGLLVVAALPEILSRPEVKPHLTTGLTTSLSLQVTASGPGGRKEKGGARVDIRYELWDEVFLVTWMGIDGRSHQESLPSFDRLLAWWRQLRLPVVRAGTPSPGVRWNVKGEISVVPFSEAERREAQRWFSDSLSELEPSPGDKPDPATGGSPSPPRSRVLDLLLATSIQRRSVATYRWTAVYRPAGASTRPD